MQFKSVSDQTAIYRHSIVDCPQASGIAGEFVVAIGFDCIWGIGIDHFGMRPP
jgi:hypothetical protein